MAITRPVIFTPIEDAEVNLKQTVSEETVRKMVQNGNMLGALAVVGSIRCFALNQHGAVTPNPHIWQEANGSQITDPDSPITSISPDDRFTPDMTNRYLRGAPNASTNTSGGSYTNSLSHTHDTTSVSHPTVGEQGEERSGYETPTHEHTIQSGLDVPQPIEMAHQQVAIYLKIG